MRKIILSFLGSISLLIMNVGFSQMKFMETYYTYNWKETPDTYDARFYSLSKSTDSGWFTTDYFLFYNGRKEQMKGLYQDKYQAIRNGTFQWFYAYSGLKTIGRYENNFKEGVWYDFYPSGDLEDSFNYSNGHLTGINMSWYENGFQKDSLNMDESGNGTYVAWFDNGFPSEAGRYMDFNKKNGKWAYYSKEGKLAELEVYDKGILQSKQYYNKNNAPVSDTTSNDNMAYFPGGDNVWTNYLLSHLKFPYHLELSNSAMVVISVSFTIDEEGNVIEPVVDVPFHPDFDKVVYNVVKDSPKWMPAIEHNRKVRSRHIQSLQYSQALVGY